MAKTSRKGPTVYLVERAAYKAWDYGGTIQYAASEGDEGASFVPVRAFADKRAAEACRAELEAEARRELPPALFTHELPRNLAAKLTAAGVTPPKFTGPDYNPAEQFRKWWADHAADLTPAQRAAVWDALKDVAFYRVTETTLEG
jgi:hypothetical protein